MPMQATDSEKATVWQTVMAEANAYRKGAAFWTYEGWQLFAARSTSLDQVPLSDLREVGVVTNWLMQEPEFAVLTAAHRPILAAEWLIEEVLPYLNTSMGGRVVRLVTRLTSAPEVMARGREARA